MLASTTAPAVASLIGAGIPAHLRTAPFVVLAAIGFVIAIFGHLTRSRLAVVLGIVLLLCATVLIPLAIYATSK